jgi:hypothetical protein
MRFVALNFPAVDRLTAPMKTLLASTLMLLCGAASAAAPEIWRFYGYAYELGSNRYLYTEVHEQYVDVENDRWLRGTITYYTPQGKLFGRKTLDFAKDPAVPEYRMEQYDLGRIEAITDAGDPIRMLLKLRPDKPEKTGSIAKQPSMTSDSGFHAFIRNNFVQIMKGEVLKFSFAVASEFDQFRFKLQRIEDTTFLGKPAVQLRVEPATLLSILVEPLYLTYDPEDRELLEFRGISNIHDLKTGKAIMARIIYPPQPPDDVPKPLPPLKPDENRSAAR